MSEFAKLHVRRLLEEVGENPDRDGLVDTPRRVVDALVEMTSGRFVDVEALLKVQFKCDTNDLVLLRRVQFASLCEHHMLPFVGHADVAYLPVKRTVVGLSKLARVVDAYAKRLQLQERLTHDIAQAIVDHLSPDVCVRLVARHSCMEVRGALKQGAEMVTTAVRGRFLSDSDLRAEAIAAMQ